MLRRRFSHLFGHPSSPQSKRAVPRRRIAEAVDVELRRRLTLEPLEARVLLSGTDPLSASQALALNNGLKGLADWADTLDTFGDVGR